jgi:hypothetical protein
VEFFHKMLLLLIFVSQTGEMNCDPLSWIQNQLLFTQFLQAREALLRILWYCYFVHAIFLFTTPGEESLIWIWSSLINVTMPLKCFAYVLGSNS